VTHFPKRQTLYCKKCKRDQEHTLATDGSNDYYVCTICRMDQPANQDHETYEP
jgi:hypothetical protein